MYATVMQGGVEVWLRYINGERRWWDSTTRYRDKGQDRGLSQDTLPRQVLRQGVPSTCLGNLS